MAVHCCPRIGVGTTNRMLRTVVWFALACVLSLFFSSQCFSAQVTLAWDPNSEADIVGYKLYYGVSSRAYCHSLDVGLRTTYTVTNLEDGKTYYFAVTAYNASNESDYSNEVNITLPARHSITASAGPNGTIDPCGSILVNQGKAQTFTITASTGYRIADVVVDGSSVGAVGSYTFSNVTTAHTIAATFAADIPSTHTISATAGQNGAISPSGTVSVARGSSQTFTITPSTGYEIADVLVDGSSVGAVTSYTFAGVTTDHSILASFKTSAVVTYTISAAAGPNGSISPSGALSVIGGTGKTFTITPNRGYAIADVLVDGSSVGAVSSYTFSKVSAPHSISASFKGVNTTPMADAGPDQKIKEGFKVTLSGLNSTTPNDGIVSYTWNQLQGTKVTLSNPSSALTTFTAPSVDPEGTSLVFQLTIKDKAGQTSTDTCVINIIRANEPPVADAGLDQRVNEWDQVVLNGSGSDDPDDGIATYSWKQLAGIQVELSDPLSAQPTFTAPSVDAKGASLVFMLTVTDHGGLQSRDICVVNVTWANLPPRAKATSVGSAYQGETVTLDASSSYDPDSENIEYRWTQLRGAPMTLSNPTAMQPSFIVPSLEEGQGTALFQVTVTDRDGLQTTDTCTVSFSDSTEQTTSRKILWTRPTDGYVALWTLNSSDIPITYKTYGPFAGWTATSYHKNADGTARILWTRPADGLTALWSLDSNDNRTGYKIFGPYPGWTATSYHKNADGTARILWTRPADGIAALWTLDGNDNRTGYKIFGPYPGWNATSYQKNADGTARILWTRQADGLVSLWTLDGNDNQTSYKLFGPYYGWTAESYN